jgi:hypothetical protein
MSSPGWPMMAIVEKIGTSVSSPAAIFSRTPAAGA